MLKLTISLSLNCQLESADQKHFVGLPLVWVGMSLKRWQDWYQRTYTAWTLVGIGVSSLRYGVSL